MREICRECNAVSIEDSCTLQKKNKKEQSKQVTVIRNILILNYLHTLLLLLLLLHSCCACGDTTQSNDITIYVKYVQIENSHTLTCIHTYI